MSSDDAQAILRRNLDEFPAVRAFSWVSPEGQVLASTMSAAVCTDSSNRDYFLAISSGKTVYMSDLRASKLTGEPIVSVARGMRSDQGELLGIVHASVLPQRLSQILTIKRAGTAVVMVLDSKGKIVFCYPQAGWAYRGEKFLVDNPRFRERSPVRVGERDRFRADGMNRSGPLTTDPHGWLGGYLGPRGGGKSGAPSCGTFIWIRESCSLLPPLL